MRRPLIKNLLELSLNIYYQCLPTNIKKIISPAVLSVKYRIISRIKNLKLNIYLLNGKEKFGENNLSILFLGDPFELKFLNYKLFKGNPTIEQAGKVYFLNIDKILEKYSKKIDAVFIKTDMFFSGYLNKKDFLITPSWLELKLDTSKELKELEKEFKKSAHEDIRLIKKNGFTYEITNDLDKFEYFYHNIRLPYLKQRLGELTIPSTMGYEETKDIFHRSNLMLIKQNEEIVSGIFILNHINSAHACYMGIKNPSKYLPKGAGAALYYFLIIWAKENNIKTLDFGNNRSFLDDGLVRYKRKWGSKLSISKRFLEINAFKIYNFKSKGIINFLINNPFTFINHKKLKGIIFSNKDLSKKEIYQLYNKYYTKGLCKLYIVSIKSNLEDVWKFLLKDGKKDFKLTDKETIKLIVYSHKKIQRLSREEIHRLKDIKNKDYYKFEDVLDSKIYDIDRSQLKKISILGCEQKFVKLLEKFPNLKKEIIKTFIHVIPSLKRRGINIDKISDQLLNDVFYHLSKGEICQDALDDIIIYMIENKEEDINKVIKQMGLRILNEGELENIIENVVRENSELILERKIHSKSIINILMGIIMEDIKGKADTKLASKILQEKIKEINDKQLF